MNEIRDYIETGILELYVLGDVTPDEKVKVEQMAAMHPAIKAELTAIEAAMEAYAQAGAATPRPDQREKILNSLIINVTNNKNGREK